MVRSQLDAYSGEDPVWGFVAQLGTARFSGSATVGHDPVVRLWVADGSIYLAERDGDAPLEDRLVASGVLTAEQLARGAVQVGNTRSLARIFSRDPSIDRDAVELALELANEQLLQEVGAQPVGQFQLQPLRHHPSGMHQWNRPVLAPPPAPAEPSTFDLTTPLDDEATVADEPATVPHFVELPAVATPTFEEMSEFERQFSFESRTDEVPAEVEEAPAESVFAAANPVVHVEHHELPVTTELDTQTPWWRRGSSPSDDATPSSDVTDLAAAATPPVAEAAPLTAAPTFELPAFETPAFDTPVFETPVFETPVFETPVFEPVPVPAFVPASFVDDVPAEVDAPIETAEHIETVEADAEHDSEPTESPEFTELTELPTLPTLGELKPWDPAAALASGAIVTTGPGHGVDPTRALAGLDLPKLATGPQSVAPVAPPAGSAYDVDPEALAAALENGPKLPDSPWAKAAAADEAAEAEVAADAFAPELDGAELPGLGAVGQRIEPDADALAAAEAYDLAESSESLPSLGESLADAGLSAPDEEFRGWDPQATDLVAVEIWEMVDGLLELEHAGATQQASSAGGDRKSGRGWLKGRKG